ncbi:type I-E CRISPR-associated endoribonuclease Cas2 [Arcanobacterium phocisimile]|uniref:Type I-E CRISPR-associated endoribonuclease Cas2 n=1 Tax=Arcanobacterium phocisimile TaxID=1302235 RepID=A0ABX7IIU9_9ACTO|nr:type I-E CRISPR-associated endoribonuclease Cas2e [Arcanobacterium phocisimile]QRV03078.1 type I-E CRISPR-associated endoribonuclease Cas2 [Arcanobacterium phocisimile]
MFAVLTISAVPEHLHGYVSRFLTEVESGVYVGNISRNVRERLWERVSTTLDEGTSTMIYSDPRQEQGFSMLTAGKNSRKVLDLDGLTVVSMRPGRGESKIRDR